MIDDEALDWVIRLRDPSFDDWAAFEAWMAASPANAAAYQELALADQDMGDLLARPAPMRAPAAVPRRLSRRTWMGGAIAASLAAIVGLQVVERMPAPYAVETGPGERRSIALAEGSVVTLNGGTRLTLDRKNSRKATVDRGQAVFAVVHDEARPFRVTVGDATLLDVGTRFDVLREGGRTRVEVSEGAVVYNPEQEAIRLDPGQSLTVADGGEATRSRVPAAAVGGWQRGHWSYDGAALETVAADLSRWSGRRITASPAAARKTFRGAISLRSGADIGGIGPAIGVAVARSGDGWVFSPRE